MRPAGVRFAALSVLLDVQLLKGPLQFTASLMTILLAHEFGHYFAARAHRVDASLPFFIPMPLLSPFGTMGAVIKMKSAIGTRRALLDIGAYGPLAGLAVAIPLYAWGAAHSHPVTLTGDGDGVILGESILLKSLDWIFAPPVPAGQELMLSPIAFAAWGGMFVTMVNLLPVGQLDAGHVAWALFGPRQDTFAKWMYRTLFAVFLGSVAFSLFDDVRAGHGVSKLGADIGDNLFWLAWFHVLGVLGAVSRTSAPAENEPPVRTRAVILLAILLTAGWLEDQPWWLAAGWLALASVASVTLIRRTDPRLFNHPPAEGTLNAPRQGVAILTLAFFVLLFMPRPIAL